MTAVELEKNGTHSRTSAARVQTDVSTWLRDTPEVRGESDANPNFKG